MCIILHEHSHKPTSPVSQLFTQLILEVCSTNASRNYIWFNVTTTLCLLVTFTSTFPYTFRAHTLFSTHTSRLSQSSNASSGPPKKKIDLQSPHPTRLSSFHQRAHHRSTLYRIFRAYFTSIRKLLYTSKTTKVTALTIVPGALRKTDK